MTSPEQRVNQLLGGSFFLLLLGAGLYQHPLQVWRVVFLGFFGLVVFLAVALVFVSRNAARDNKTADSETARYLKRKQADEEFEKEMQAILRSRR